MPPRIQHYSIRVQNCNERVTGRNSSRSFQATDFASTRTGQMPMESKHARGSKLAGRSRHSSLTSPSSLELWQRLHAAVSAGLAWIGSLGGDHHQRLRAVSIQFAQLNLTYPTIHPSRSKTKIYRNNRTSLLLPCYSHRFSPTFRKVNI